MGGSLEIDVEKCKGCGLCVDACPIDYLKMSFKTNQKGYYYPVAGEGCTGCGICYTMCPDVCITVNKE